MKIQPLGNRIKPIRTGFTLVPREDAPRTAGLHQSDIASKLMKELGYYDNREMDWDRIAVGLIMEAQIEYALREVYLDVCRPGEFSVMTPEGPIYVTPDGYDPGEDALHELKATWYSAGNGIDSNKFFNWHVQLKIGCLALDCLDAYLHVFFVNGDWKPPVPWPIQTYKFTFTPTELVENVEMLSNFVRDRKALFT